MITDRTGASEGRVGIHAYLGLAVLCCLTLSAQDRTSDSLMDFMYSKFSASFVSAKDSGENPEFLVLASPGISLNPAQMRTPSYEISMLLDQVPQPSRIYQRSGYRYSTIYERILSSAYVTRYQVMADRDKALDAKRAIFDKSRPGRPTPAYAAFLKYRSLYAVALDAQTIAIAEAQAAKTPAPPGLDQAVDKARKNWETLGYRAQIQKALDALHKVYDTNSLAMFQNLRYDFQKAQLRGNQAQAWLPVETYPPVEEWLSREGWHSWTFHQSDVQQATPKDATPLPPAKTKADPDAAGWTPAMSLSVEVKRVEVARTWMDRNILSVHTWLLKDATGFTVVSTGNPTDQDPGPMPILVTGILLARNLSLTGYAPRTSANGGTLLPDRVGPFDLGGSRSGGTPLSRQVAKRAAGTSITVPDPQIIAFFCQVVPKSPTPDPKFFR
jgi:hypothetical protein